MESRATKKGESSPSSQEAKRTRLNAARIRLLFAQSEIGSMGAIFCAAILAGALWNVVSHDRIVVWAAAYGAVFLVRRYHIHSFQRVDGNDHDEVTRQGKRHAAVINASAVLWGAAGVCLFPEDSSLHQFILSIVVSGIAAASAVINSPTNLYASNVLLILAPLSARFFYEGDEFHWTIGLVILVFAAVFLLTGRKMHAVYTDSLALRYDNEELVVNLKKEIARRDQLELELKMAHDDLEARVEARTAELKILNRTLEQEVLDRKRIEAALRAGERSYQDLVASVPIGIFRFRMKARGGWNFDYVSDRWCELNGLTREEVMNDAEIAFHRIHPDDLDAFVALNESARRTLNAFEWEGRVVINGEDRWAHIESKPALMENGDIVWNGAHLDITERRRAQGALRASEERLHLVLNSATDGFWDWDLVTGHIWRSPGWTVILGYTLEETAPELAAWHKLVHPDDLPKVMKVIENHLSGSDAGYTNEYRILTRTGDWKWLLDRSKVVARDRNGKPLRVVGAFHDISDRKSAEAALLASESQFRSLFETSFDAILLTAPDGRVFDANHAACRAFGYTEQEFREIGREGVVDRTDPGLLGALEERRRTGRFMGELSFRRKDGTTFPAEISSTLFESADGEPKASIIVRDVTERKRAEEALKASGEKHRVLVEKAREAIFVVQDTVFRFTNPMLEEIIGFSADELIGRSFAEFVHPDDREMVIDKHYRRLEGEVFPSRYEIRILDKNRQVKWAEIDSAVIDWEGRPAAMVFLSDITFRKSAEEAAVHSARLRAIADLSQGVAHHFNNLLQIVTASASLSISDLESGDSTEVKATLERMLSAASRGAEMVRRLHIFANARTDYHAGDEITFDVSDTARNAAEILSPLWKTQPEETGPKIDLQLDLKEGCLTLGRENEVFEVLVNLIRNAAEALPAGGAIHVETRREAEEVVINVRDTGPGISEEDLTRVFQPFWSTKGLGIGKGMGLAVTHGLVKGHGGVISVQSKPGKGAAFTVRLPKAPDSALR